MSLSMTLIAFLKASSTTGNLSRFSISKRYIIGPKCTITYGANYYDRKSRVNYAFCCRIGALELKELFAIIPGFLCKQERKLLWTQKGVRATVVTAGHCTHAELNSGSGHALASCYSCCVHSRGLC